MEYSHNYATAKAEAPDHTIEWNALIEKMAPYFPK